ncbi:MAG TPA: divergent polysaccharide deacetylase family protein [Candidatus Acidoferrum sp.]|nr:divergent polysaccharide deacetylase family protein [Candidatus Acidoferrum sp.]
MKRRRSRRRSNLSPAPIIAALAATAVLAGAVELIVRGDVTPRPVHRVAHHRRSTEVAATSVPTAAPLETSPPAVAAAPTASPVATAGPEATATPLAAPMPTAIPASSTPAASAETPSPKPAAPVGGARLALIIDDCGQWPETERGFIALPAPLTLSVLPHVRYGDAIAHEAVAARKGVMLHLPMEPRAKIYPGPGEITVAMNDEAIASQVADDIASVPLATGVNNHEGSRATSDDRVMREVSSVLAQRHLFFIDSRTSAASVGARDAEAVGVPTASRDVFLDDVADLDATEAQLRRAAEIAKTHGSAIAIGHPRPTTLAAVRTLLPELQKEGIDFVLARDLVR